MPMTAMIRNLGKMSSLQMFDDDQNVAHVVKALTNPHKLKTARVHPMKILLALVQYKQGVYVHFRAELRHRIGVS